MFLVEVRYYPYHEVLILLVVFCREGEMDVLVVCVTIHRKEQSFGDVFRILDIIT